MSTLETYNLCMDIVSRNIEMLAKECPTGAVLAFLDKKTRKVKLLLFRSFQQAREYRDKLDDPDSAPIVPIQADIALML